MNSGCCGGNTNNVMPVNNGVIQGWTDLQQMCPKDIRDLIAMAKLGGTEGTFTLSSTFLDSAWTSSPLKVSNLPIVAANRTDNGQMVAEAEQWNFQHLTWNSAASVPPPLQNTIFVRSGTQWNNSVFIDFGVSTVTNIQISFLVNGATRGDKQGTVAVIEWDSLALTGEQEFNFTFKRTGVFCLGIRATIGGNATMFRLDLNSVA